MSLSNDVLLSMSFDISDCFEARRIKKHFSDYCIKNGLEKDLPSKKRTENKGDYVRRMFSCFQEEEQVGLIHYLAEQDECLKNKETVQKVLYRLAEIYGSFPKTIEEQERQTEIEHLLATFPGSLELWQKALSYKLVFQYRESLDSARLSLEKLLKDILGNNKSLENQRPELGRWLSAKRVPIELTNMIWTGIEKYTSFQNNHVKHELPFGLTSAEVDFILDETYVIIRYLTKRAKEMTHE